MQLNTFTFSVVALSCLALAACGDNYDTHCNGTGGYEAGLYGTVTAVVESHSPAETDTEGRLVEGSTLTLPCVGWEKTTYSDLPSIYIESLPWGELKTNKSGASALRLYVYYEQGATTDYLLSTTSPSTPGNASMSFTYQTEFPPDGKYMSVIDPVDYAGGTNVNANANLQIDFEKSFSFDRIVLEREIPAGFGSSATTDRLVLTNGVYTP